MTAPAEPPALVDTNVLVYSTDRSAPQHAASRTLLDRASRGELELRITPQVVFEFIATVTNGRRVAVRLTREQAWGAMEKICAVCQLAETPSDLVDRVAALVPTVEPEGAEIFDLAIGASALAANVTLVFTYDAAVMSRVPGLSVRAPR